MLDELDKKILERLRINARQSNRDIGESIHLTGQAVGSRIRRMEEMGVIHSYTVRVDEGMPEDGMEAIVLVFMKTADHQAFLTFVKDTMEIVEAHRISGDPCYSLKCRVNSQQTLNALLDKILLFGNYRLNLSIKQIK